MSLVIEDSEPLYTFLKLMKSTFHLGGWSFPASEQIEHQKSEGPWPSESLYTSDLLHNSYSRWCNEVTWRKKNTLRTQLMQVMGFDGFCPICTPDTALHISVCRSCSLSTVLYREPRIKFCGECRLYTVIINFVSGFNSMDLKLLEEPESIAVYASFLGI